ncbi:MAG: thiamine phosphate synthase [Candidatus Diapherotrites archaeon]
MKGYYFITDASLSKAGNISDVQNAIAARVSVIQYRNKNASIKQMCFEASQLKDLCSEKTKLIINDRADVALAVDADGVHLGQDDLDYKNARTLLGTDKIIGVTVHTLEEAISAEKKGADYLGISPIFETSTKKDAGNAVGLDLIKEIKSECTLPIIAIGGITLENAKSVVDAGADGLCAISSVVTKENVKIEILKFQELFK